MEEHEKKVLINHRSSEMIEDQEKDDLQTDNDELVLDEAGCKTRLSVKVLLLDKVKKDLKKNIPLRKAYFKRI